MLNEMNLTYYLTRFLPISRQTIELLNSLNAKYGSFDILSDESVRQGLKTYSNWPTYPQIYVKGK